MWFVTDSLCMPTTPPACLQTPPYYTSVQKGVADQMGKTAEEFEAQFIFGLGDNFCMNEIQRKHAGTHPSDTQHQPLADSHGISCTDDPAPDCKTNVDSHRFADTFDKVYTAPSLQKQCVNNTPALPSPTHQTHTQPSLNPHTPLRGCTCAAGGTFLQATMTTWATSLPRLHTQSNQTAGSTHQSGTASQTPL